MATAEVTESADETLPHAKPPFLRRVRIRGYKSIAFCDVTLEPLTVFVGRNAAGKSNFLDALAFLRDTIDVSATDAVKKRGWNSIRCRTADLSPINIQLDVGFQCGPLSYQGKLPPTNGLTTFPNFLGREFTATYELEIEVNEHGVPLIGHESLEFTDQDGKSADGFKVFRGGTGDNYSHTLHWKPGVATPSASQQAGDALSPHRADHTVLATIGFQPFADFSNGLRFMGFYNPHPDAIRRLQKPLPWTMLEKDSSNLVSVIRDLDQLDPASMKRVKQYVTHIAPEVVDFVVHELGQFATIRFRNSAGQTDPPLEFDAENMSDGTLRVLSNIVAVFQQEPPYGNPSVVGIEEPETALHPGAMNALVDALDEATLRTQVLLTTHSAELLDNPTIKPENVRVVQMIDGQTVIAPVDDATVEIVKRNLNTLGGLERDNHLEPNLDDLERQQRLRDETEASAP